MRVIHINAIQHQRRKDTNNINMNEKFGNQLIFNLSFFNTQMTLILADLHRF
jgi:hypothetical protein